MLVLLLFLQHYQCASYLAERYEDDVLTQKSCTLEGTEMNVTKKEMDGTMMFAMCLVSSVAFV